MSDNTWSTGAGEAGVEERVVTQSQTLFVGKSRLGNGKAKMVAMFPRFCFRPVFASGVVGAWSIHGWDNIIIPNACCN